MEQSQTSPQSTGELPDTVTPGGGTEEESPTTGPSPGAAAVRRNGVEQLTAAERTLISKVVVVLVHLPLSGTDGVFLQTQVPKLLTALSRDSTKRQGAHQPQPDAYGCSMYLLYTQQCFFSM